MPTVKFHFPGGRYHATPWGYHVNEGLIEWPPCPWRLLRALLACGFTKLGWQDVAKLPPHARSLVEKLAAVLPRYHLPPATAAHSRHYMPVMDGKTPKTTLVFDTWANIGDGHLLVHWPCVLDPEEKKLLHQLVSQLGYLGRSESWVQAELLCDDPATDWNAVPCQEKEHRGPGWEQVSLLAALSPQEYVTWQKQSVSVKSLSSSHQGRGTKKSATKNPYPPDLLSCLTKDTVWWKEQGWSQPPGSQRVLYWRRTDSLQVSVPIKQQRQFDLRVNFILLAITSPSGNKSALPSVTRTLPQAELFHRAILGKLGKGQRVYCPELTGKDPNGKPLQNGHQHAHILPIDLDQDNHLDHILVYAPMGLGKQAQEAIRSLNRTWTKGGVGDLQLAVAGKGDLDRFIRLPDPWNRSLRNLLGLPPNGARVWESVTPFVPPRFVKQKGKNSFEEQIREELKSRGLISGTNDVQIELSKELTKQLRHFVRRRFYGRTVPKVDMGYGLRLRFDRPVQGPILLGYGSHFGLGLMRATNNNA